MEDSLSDGIDENSALGWYWWSEDRYVLVDDEMITALHNADYFQQ